MLALKDGRYSPEAFRFLFEALPHAMRLAGKGEAQSTPKHVTGQEVVAGLRMLAAQQFGPLAAGVWRSWGVNSTLDWGQIVFLLVENRHLNRQESDTLEDFREGFDFDEVFVRQYRVPLSEATTGDEG
ncbi:MAG TPA: Minf_1886 family protein [Planctomycetota bacterium]